MEDLTKFYTGSTILKCSNGFYLENMSKKDANEAFLNREDIFGIYNNKDECIGYLKESNEHSTECDYGIRVRYEVQDNEQELGQSNFLEKVCEFLFRKYVSYSSELLIISTSQKDHLTKFSNTLLEEGSLIPTNTIEEATERLDLIRKLDSHLIQHKSELSVFRDSFYNRFSNYIPNILPERDETEERITKYLLDISIGNDGRIGYDFSVINQIDESKVRRII